MILANRAILASLLVQFVNIDAFIRGTYAEAILHRYD